MSRPWRVWFVFALCAGMVLAAIAWISRDLLRLERAQQAANRRADLEERVRLALWRMDTALTSLLIEESAQPSSAFEWATAKSAAAHNTEPPAASASPVPNAPATSGSSNVVLRFQLAMDGRLTSPQSGDGLSDRLAELRRILDQPAAPAAGAVSAYDNRALLVHESGTVGAVEPVPAVPLAQVEVAGRDTDVAQLVRNALEFNQRANISQQAQQTAVDNLVRNTPRRSVVEDPNGSGGVFRPIWLGDHLFLARSAQSRGVPVVQGVWLNWGNVRASLLASIRDLFASADLLPVRQPEPRFQDRMLAALPVQLVPPAVSPVPSAGWTPLRITLSLTWACVLIAVLSVAVLLQGALSLSERRGAFVSAVTHEMRTPITTFRMYSEMLADGMVADAGARQQYLSTLRTEANRLSHLVENVLAYARLERGNRRARAERIRLHDLLDRVRPRLLERATQAGLQLAQEADPDVVATVVQVDPAAVEQILFNLVDNACKYAASSNSKPAASPRCHTADTSAVVSDCGRRRPQQSATPESAISPADAGAVGDGRGPGDTVSTGGGGVEPHRSKSAIHLEARVVEGHFVALRVRDHGPGIDAAMMRRLFQPFSKSANEAARSAPGVGLGLALSRRLSRSLGGDLRLDLTVKDGACFELRLPLRGKAE